VCFLNFFDEKKNKVLAKKQQGFISEEIGT